VATAAAALGRATRQSQNGVPLFFFFYYTGLFEKKKFSVKLLRLVVDRGHGQQDKDRHTESSFMNPDFRRYGVSAS
jgi:hypothetical protein